jgi:hypothetical protein
MVYSSCFFLRFRRAAASFNQDIELDAPCVAPLMRDIYRINLSEPDD